ALAASDAMRAHEAALSVAGTPLAAIFDRDDPAAVAAARAEWYALRRLLLTQLAYVLRVHAG
ncbi:MAG: hypothetical protein ACOC3J_03870, partial [Gemmatimonadota bacterium]